MPAAEIGVAAPAAVKVAVPSKEKSGVGLWVDADGVDDSAAMELPPLSEVDTSVALPVAENAVDDSAAIELRLEVRNDLRLQC